MPTAVPSLPWPESGLKKGLEADDLGIKSRAFVVWVSGRGFRNQGLGFRIQGLGHSIQGLGFRV